MPITLSLYPIFQLRVTNHWDLVRSKVGILQQVFAYRFRNDMTIAEVELIIRDKIIEQLKIVFPSTLKERITFELMNNGVEAKVLCNINHFGLIEGKLHFYFQFDLEVKVENYHHLIYSHLGKSMRSRLIAKFFKDKAIHLIDKEIYTQLYSNLLIRLQPEITYTLESRLRANGVLADVTVEVGEKKPKWSAYL